MANKAPCHFIITTIRGLFPLIFILFNIGIIRADDPGITKVRLIQLNDTSYRLEADVSQAVLWAIKSPVFPQRFRFSDFDYESQSGWITLRTTFTTSGESLSPEDEILLPWTRNGVDITVQWKEGDVYKGFFTRTLNGIHIPLRELMPDEKSTLEIVRENMLSGFKHLIFKGIHIFLILSLVWVIPRIRVLRYLLWYSFGQAAALILAELGVPGFNLLLADLLLLLIILLLSYSAISHRKVRYLGMLLFIAAMLHGLAFRHDLSVLSLPPVQRIQALFCFNLALDASHFLLALILLLVIPRIQNGIRNSKWIPLAIGSISIFFVLLLFTENVGTGKTQILGLTRSNIGSSYTSTARAASSTRQAQRSTGGMTTPIMVYLSVEPYEIREEILVKAVSALAILGLDQEYEVTIPIDRQEGIKNGLIDSIRAHSKLVIDDQPARPSEVQASFVVLNRGGVSIRENPVEESLEEGILGITLVYDIESFPDSATMDWKLFPPSVPYIEASAVDPHGAITRMLNPDGQPFRWKRKLVGASAPEIRAVSFARPALPLVSLFLWAALLIYAASRMAARKQVSPRYWMIAILGLGFVFYPFLRFDADLPFMPQGKPSAERTIIVLNDLLTNVYRAFDRRVEEDVYDRLALTVTGDQLTDIYLQNRQALAMENRGGARAKVDEVNILELYDVDRSGQGAFVADLVWTVRGSVNHFGHTHYRQNQYRAMISFVSDEKTWKINHIETIDEQRIY